VTRTFAFSELATADLVVDAVYEGGKRGNAGDDPLSRLLPCGNQGGFRYNGSLTSGLRMAVLYSSGADADWPDTLDRETGSFTYFGDNKRPGHELHDTPRSGNKILRHSFGILHDPAPQRREVPPFFVFTKASAAGGRDVRFLGLAVPGAPDVEPTDDLVAVWRTADGERFQNYRSTFTILDVAQVERSWFEQLLAGDALGRSCPAAFRAWVEAGTYVPLRAPRNIQWRTPLQQRPASAADADLVREIYDFFVEDPHSFEACAIELWRMQANAPVTFVATRRSADGGRDAYGKYKVGPDTDPIYLEWSLEAKLYAPENGVGVKGTSRLISRLRHREFGVLVTTSFVGKQAYEELRGDRHPVVIICGRDIADLLKRHGHGTPTAVRRWLSANFSQLPDSLPAADPVGES
jgi:hypothetical protein